MLNLKQQIEAYLDNRQYQRCLDRKTLKAYRADLTQYMNFCKEYPDQNPFERDLLEAFTVHLHKTFKPKTAKRKIASLKAFFIWLERKDTLPDNPFRKLDLSFREPKVLPKTIPFQEIQAFLSELYTEKEQAKNDYQQWRASRNLAVMELLFATGMRISELCNLTDADIDLEGHTVRIFGKGSKERILQIEHPDTLKILIEWISIRPDTDAEGYFFRNRNDTPLSDQSVRRMICQTADRAAIKRHLTPHMFRHSFATLLMDQGVDTRYIQQMLGHASISTTQIYTHVSGQKQREILKTMHPRNRMQIH